MKFLSYLTAFALSTIAGFAIPSAAFAHFGMIIPSQTMISQDDGREITLTYSFAHPFEGQGMVLEPPLAATADIGGGTQDIVLKPEIIMGAPGFSATVSLGRPGVHVLGMVPQPYWEPAEDVFIQHFTKTYVAAFGSDEGWDAMLGYPVEIAPLSRPFGLWAGNLFQGIVMRAGAPVPYAEVEVETFAAGGVDVPSELMITQTIKADAHGVFSYVPPFAGWWGFAALLEGPETMMHDGVPKAVEQGGVIWVHFEETP